MPASALMAGVLLAQAAAPITVEGSPDRVEVAYEQLAAGQPERAVERIHGDHRPEVGDPAALINLGTAYARLGQTGKARDRYYAAIASKVRYDLELADGRWMDSRRAARLAVQMLARNQTLALR